MYSSTDNRYSRNANAGMVNENYDSSCTVVLRQQHLCALMTDVQCRLQILMYNSTSLRDVYGDVLYISVRRVRCRTLMYNYSCIL